MASAESAPSGRVATQISERRIAWNPRVSGMASLQVEDQAAPAALLAGESVPAIDGTDQASAASPSAAQVDGIPGTDGSAQAMPVWQGVLQVQGFIAMNAGAVQRPADDPGDIDAASRRAVDAAPLMQLARAAQAAAAVAPQASQDARKAAVLPQDWDGTTPQRTLQAQQAPAGMAASAAQIINAVEQETHLAPAVPAQEVRVAQALSAQQDADQSVDAKAAWQDAVASSTNAGPSAPRPAAIQASRAVQGQSTQPAQPPIERADLEIADDHDGATPPDSGRGSRPGPARVVDSVTGSVPRPTVQHLSPVSRSPSQPSGDHVDASDSANTAPVSEHAAAAVSGEPAHASSVVPTPAHQVATQIASAVEVVKSQAAAPLLTSDEKPGAAPVVKVLRIELQPADLGTITIRMSLKEDGLDIRLEASRYDTAHMLRQDQDSLAKLLTGAGYRIDGMTIASAPTHASAAIDGASQAFQSSSAPPQHGGAAPHSDSRSSGGRQEPQSNPGTPRSNQDDDHDKNRPARGPGGDLYV